MDETTLLQRRLHRERAARLQAEGFLEAKALELYEANNKLQHLNESLEQQIQDKLAELHQSEVRLSTLITSLHSGVMVENEHHRVLLANQMFCDLFAIPLPPSQMVGLDCNEARQQVKGLFAQPDEFMRRMESLLMTRQPSIGEEVLMLDGRTLEFDYVPIYQDNVYLGHLWRYTDVTEKYLAREAIRRSEEKYRGIMNNMELGLLEVDNEQTILRAYERCCRMLGYAEHELIGQNARDLLVAPEYIRVLDQQQRDRERGMAGSYELQLIRKDGERVWVLVSGVPINDENGRIVGSMGIHYDLTERKRLETELAKAKQVAEEAQQAEKQFLANMSHEIRTPLNAIIGMTHLLFDTRPTTQQREYIDILKTSADFLHSLISDLLDMTKIEAGRVDVHTRPFDLAGLLRATQKVFEMKLQNRPITIDVMLDARIGDELLGDDVMLNQILMNLVGNAEKFTEQGHIQITARIRQQEENRCWIEFSVADTGIGIPEEKLGLVFQKFKQVNAHGHKHKGTGLGLAITKELVELQGGTISVKSRVGEGSTFTFALPFSKAPEAVAPVGAKGESAPAPTQALINCQVLVVEDNLMNQTYIGSLLTKWQIPYTLASDGKKAVEAAKARCFDLILMDIQMPIMDGYEATVAIRNTHNPNQHTPIVALTASAMLDHKSTAMAAGMNDFLTKPFEPNQLMAVLQQYATTSRPPVVTVSTTPDPLNRQRLTDLYGSDTSHAAEMFQLFLSAVVPDLNELPDLARARDWPRLARAAHKLKPALGMVGLTDLEQALYRIERAAGRADAPDSLLQDCTTLLTQLHTLQPFLQSELNRLLSPNPCP